MPSRLSAIIMVRLELAADDGMPRSWVEETLARLAPGDRPAWLVDAIDRAYATPWERYSRSAAWVCHPEDAADDYTFAAMLVIDALDRTAGTWHPSLTPLALGGPAVFDYEIESDLAGWLTIQAQPGVSLMPVHAVCCGEAGDEGDGYRHDHDCRLAILMRDGQRAITLAYRPYATGGE